MKKMCWALSSALLLICLTAGLATAKSRTITLINKSGATFFHMYVSPPDKKEWRKDYLDNVVENNESVQIEFAPPTNECRWDLMVHDSEGREIIWSGVDLCKKKLVLRAGQGGTSAAEAP
jgi:hypothetical protein